MKKGRFKDRIRIERPVAETSVDGAGSGTWVPVGMAWAEVQDSLPSRGERVTDGINVTTGPSRVRMSYRAGITSAMRIVVVVNGRDERIGQIVTRPAVIGRRDGLEFIVEDYSPAGNGA